ncbi:hypothetical protein UCDDS831_g09267 [Diplodia seriata]|uniref:Uncharacterized protein n=1 Tax=Diplodia seriata TaxID=420778 RepID=A0A0G2DR45_9PEZI|nr:hypothetical protein UCDDS831_g09267 [Diplodia seriata]
MAQPDFATNPWMSGWAVEFGDKPAQLGCGFGPSDCAPGMAAPNGGMCMYPSPAAGAKQPSNNPGADSWMRDCGMAQNGNTMPIINAQLMPLDHTGINPQLQINTAFNQSQFAAQLQAAYAQQFIYSPGITSPLLLDSETTAEDLYDWQNGDEENGDPYGCVDPSSTQYNADPYNSFSCSANGSFSYPEPIASPIETAQPSTQANGEPCRSPFPESWDLATALRAHAESAVAVAVPDSSISSFSSTGVDSAIDQSSPGAIAAAEAQAAAAENKRRYSSGYSSAAVDLLLNRFRENAANPIKKRRSWRKNLNVNVNGNGGRAAMAGKMTVMGAVGQEEMGGGPGPALGVV